MKKLLNGKGLGGVAALVSACAGALALVVYLIYNLVIGKFTADVFAMIVLGLIFAAVTLMTEFKFAPVLSVLGFSLAIGLYLNNRIIMFEEMINHIVGMTERGDSVPVVILILVLLFVAAISGIVVSFSEKKAA